jgi:hypothetical protein
MYFGKIRGKSVRFLRSFSAWKNTGEKLAGKKLEELSTYFVFLSVEVEESFFLKYSLFERTFFADSFDIISRPNSDLVILVEMLKNL